MSKLYDLLYTMIGKLNSSVKTTAQTLTDAEKTQARANIGAQPAGDYAEKKDIPTVPTKVSAFTNDAGYLTEHQDLSEYAKKTEIPTVPTKVSAFTNDAGYLTQHQDLSAYAKKTEIPSKLPNPHALTINGKTYDGSSAVSVKVDGAQADWNAAEGEPGHVKHRTHWIDVDIVEILPETQAKIQSSQYDEALSFVPLLEVKQGDIITVAINGMEYKCAAQLLRNNIYVFGDGNYFGLGNSGAGEPFCVLYMAGSNSGVYVKQDCTISIYKDNSIIHKLDKKFLPDDIGGGMGGADWNASEGEPGHVLNRTHWVEKVDGVTELSVTGEWMENEPGEWGFITFAPIGLEGGRTYVVNWNGTEYTCTAKDVSDIAGIPGTIMLGNGEPMGLEGTDEPFMFMEYTNEWVVQQFGGMYDVIMSMDATSNIPFTISAENEIVHKMPPKFIPNTIYTVVAEVNESNLQTTTNKTYEEVAIQAADPNIQVRALIKFLYEGRLAAYFYANLVEFNTLAGKLIFMAQQNAYTYHYFEMRSDGSCSYTAEHYKYNNT